MCISCLNLVLLKEALLLRKTEQEKPSSQYVPHIYTLTVLHILYIDVCGIVLQY